MLLGAFGIGIYTGNLNSWKSYIKSKKSSKVMRRDLINIPTLKNSTSRGLNYWSLCISEVNNSEKQSVEQNKIELTGTWGNLN